MIFAPTIPLQFDDTYGYENVQSLQELVRFHLTNLILTNPGEKITDSNYGVGIRRYLFENRTSETFSNIRGAIQTQVEKYLTYLTLSKVSVTNSSLNKNLINIKLFYRVNDISETDVLNIDLNLETGATVFGNTTSY